MSEISPEIYKAAIGYHKAGLCVLPTHGNRKNPALANWKDYQTKKPTLQEVETWFSNPSCTGILLVCGEISNVTVIDDDGYKTNKPLDISSPLEASTTTGGRHVYFQYSPEVKSQNIRTEDHEFEIQNDGKLVMMPPSTAINKHGEIGQYTWTVTDESRVANLPTVDKDFTVKYQTDRIEKVEMSELLSVDLGSQHNALRTMMNKLLFQTAEEDWEEKLKPILFAAAAEYNPPHPEHRVEKLWQDCTDFVRSRRVDNEKPKTLEAIARERAEERKLEKIAPKTGYKNLDKIIKGFIPGHVYLVSGDTNVGKTSISANFAVNVAEQGKNVLYFALEPDNTVIDYLNTVAFNVRFDEITKDYTNEHIKVYTKSQVKDINHMIALVGQLPRQDLIIVDHFGYFTSDDKQPLTVAQGNAIKRMISLAKSKRSAIILISHIRKGTKGLPTREDISGSKTLIDDATDVLLVIKDQAESEYGDQYQDTGAIVVSKGKNGPNGFMKIKFKEMSAKIYDADDMLSESIKKYLF